MIKTIKVPFDRSRSMAVATIAADGIYSGLYATQLMRVHDALERQLIGVTGTAWQAYGKKMLAFIKDYAASMNSGDNLGNVPFSVFMAKGNKKLPFVTFGTLPVVLCPGAGECASFCYSLKAWRYPAAFFGMLQNSLLLGHALGRQVIASKFNAIKPDATVRLYVDGDFANISDVEFWTWAISKRPDLAVYGYSKSFNELIDADNRGFRMPSNYKLNISSGHNADVVTVAKVKKLPMVRGDFIAITANKGTTNGELIANYKLATGRKAFACPGKCGTCTSIGHACGNDKFNNIDIIIKVH